MVADLVRHRGPVPLDEVLDLALYHPSHGFYGGGAGAAGRRGGDFVTSPEVGPLYGAVLARALGRWWDELGRPDPFVVVEAGAGRGTLARAVFDAEPVCGPALRYVLVERSDFLRRAQADLLPLATPSDALSPSPHQVPLATSLGELPTTQFTGVVLANELLDNLPFRLLERSDVFRQESSRADESDAGWAEVRLGTSPRGNRLVEHPVPAPDLATEADRLGVGARTGARIPIQHAAADWLRSALLLLERGRVVVVDYADTNASMAERPWTDWVRTYRSHERGGSPFAGLGTQDVTCEVAVDQLAVVTAPSSDRSQADFLRANGLDDLVAEGRQRWAERAHVGDLDAVRHRSRVREAEALIDADGLGAFRVLEWEVGCSRTR